MRSSSLLGLVAVGLSVVVGCSSEPAEDAAATEGAASVGGKIQTGTYEGELDLVVKGTAIEGSYFSQIGDPEHGGATCSFTIAGIIEVIGGVEHAHITATDAMSVTGGELIAKANGSLNFKLNTLPNACMRVSPMLTEGFDLGSRAAISTGADTQGFRSVKAEKAFFYDRAGGAPRAAYVVEYDRVVITGPEQSGFIPAKFNNTKGFLKTADLMDTHAPVLRDTIRAAYDVAPNDGIDAGVEVVTAHGRDMFFNLTSVNKFGGQNIGDLQMEHAPIVGDTATWTGDGCTITFAFASDAKSVKVEQEGMCSDFGANVVVSGTYNRK
jgi:hypothetical protein